MAKTTHPASPTMELPLPQVRVSLHLDAMKVEIVRAFTGMEDALKERISYEVEESLNGADRMIRDLAKEVLQETIKSQLRDLLYFDKQVSGTIKELLRKELLKALPESS